MLFREFLERLSMVDPLQMKNIPPYLGVLNGRSEHGRIIRETILRELETGQTAMMKLDPKKYETKGISFSVSVLYQCKGGSYQEFYVVETTSDETIVLLVPWNLIRERRHSATSHRSL